jgi:hypothetical protein
VATSQSDLSNPEGALPHYGTAGSTLQLWAAAPVTLLLPSDLARVDRAKLTLVSTLAATFFLFAGKTWLPGGAFQFMRYADAIVHGTTLPPDIAQRDAGYPLLIILSGFPFSQSLIPLFLIQAGFAILLPLLVYESLQRLSPRTAFYAGLASILMLSPFYFMKMIHHDQTYIFFSMLILCSLLIFVQTKRFRFLYLFTIFAIYASVVRPAGNALFPLFLIVSYIAVRGGIAHYAACSIIFAVFLAGYAWHRHVIFDVAHAQATPSYTGAQSFYNPYLNTLDYGIKLSPNDVGPNFAQAVTTLRNRLQPNPQQSEFVRKHYLGSAGEQQFAAANMFGLTPEQLIDQVLASPNYEYYTLLCEANDDRVMLAAALEIARAYPGMILRYSIRNLLHFIFEPGYRHTRYTLNPFMPVGLVFFLASDREESVVTGEVDMLPAQAAREVNFDSLWPRPQIISRLLDLIQRVSLKLYRIEALIVACLMTVAWATVAARVARLDRVWPSRRNSNKLDLGAALPLAGGLVTSIIIGSLLFGYNAVVTSIFAEPDFRYREMMDLPAIVIAGLGLIAIPYWAGVAPSRHRAAGLGKRWNHAVRSVYARDVWQRFTATQLAIIVIGVAIVAFASWTIFMLENILA